MVRKVVKKVSDELLQKDLEKYRKKAIEFGATDAKIITTDMVLIDERVRAKCIYPKCHSYGTNANCPPHAMEVNLVREIVNDFTYAIFLMMKLPSETMAGNEAREKDLGRKSRIRLHEIVAKIESEAFYDGYHLALGFAGGSCKMNYCPDTECSALIPGQGCRHPLKARSAMEAVGMDAFAMAASVGWDVYPIGRSIPPSDVPHGSRLGLILVY